jgi:phenylalanyl-tRNA synthetase beta chain
MVSSGLYETVSYAFTNSLVVDMFGGQDDTLYVHNPISAHLDVLRPSLIPNILMQVHHHLTHHIPSKGLFEIGARYHPALKNKQETVLAFAVWQQDTKHWQGERDTYSPYYAKALVNKVLQSWGLDSDRLKHDVPPSWLHPYQGSTLSLGKTVVATYGAMHPKVLSFMDIQSLIVVGEIYIDRLGLRPFKGHTKPSLPPMPYPATCRDLAFVMPASMDVGALLGIFKTTAKKILNSINVFDCYQGDKVPLGYKSVAVHLVFQSLEKTLTEKDVDTVIEELVQIAHQKLGISLRT